MKIKLYESELISLIKKIIKEEKTSVEDIKYKHPKTNKECLIKVAKHRHSNMGSSKNKEYRAVLVCDEYNNGEYSVVYELPIFGKNFNDINNTICDNIERVFKFLDKNVSARLLDGESINENTKYSKWDVIDRPIFCSAEEDDFLDY